MKYKGVIFDLDGVICHTDVFHYKAWKALADKLGIYFDEEINNRLRGVSRMESLEIVLERYSGTPLTEQEKTDIATEKNEIYKASLMQMDETYLTDNVMNTLKTLRENGVKLAIGSSSKNAELILERIGLGNFFDAIADGNMIKNSKPHPEVFLLAAEKIALPPADCLVIEDAKAGIEAAVAGKFHSVGMGDAASDDSATYHIDKFSEMSPVVLGDTQTENLSAK